MENMILMARALNFIEDHLTSEVKTEDIAEALFVSKSKVEKLFKTVTRTSIRDYMIRRRMSLAAKDIRENEGEESFLDIALKYGYGSNEAFTRAFKGVWHVTPSEYRKCPARYELYPAFRLDPELMEDDTMFSRKKVDISELYDCFLERKNCYIVGVDISSLIPINNISIEAGDIAILTAMDRLAQAAGEEDIVFRIGGDEFVALTDSEDPEYASRMVEEIRSHNGEPIFYRGQEIPLHLHVTSYQLKVGTLRYADVYSQMQQNMDAVKPKK